ncbi:hypothetical protein ACF3M1_16300 [Luteimonas sp. WGS1318]|uniref:hypothetical protein n=1 Tax=Luteimonas sp. WGS1318 TaxID=3366815 RepID=UPI00372D84F5
MLGPGRADLLDGIRDTGSGPVVGRHMDTRNPRAWNRVDALNRSFRQSIVAMSKGASGGGDGTRPRAFGAQRLAT